MKIPLEIEKVAEVIECAPAEVHQRSKNAVDWNLKTVHSFETAMDEVAKRALLDICDELQRNEDGTSKISETTRARYNLAFIQSHSMMRARETAPQIVVKMDAATWQQHQQARREAETRALKAAPQP